jgi:hypothetical protein
MERAQAAPFDRFRLLFLGVSASLVGLLAVIGCWRSFSPLAKCNAVIFLLILVSSPLFEILAEKRGRELGRFHGSTVGYILTILALTLFVKH